MTEPRTDQTAMKITRSVCEISGASQGLLFGSRARGDHRPDSDVDLVVIIDPPPTEEQLEEIRSRARKLQKSLMPQASGIDILCMNHEEFQRRSHLRNNLANTIAKEGTTVVSSEGTEYSFNYEDEEIDWQDVTDRLRDANNAAADLDFFLETGQVDRVSDKSFGRVAQSGLENAYKAVLGSHGAEYPSSGRDGHNLRILVEQFRMELSWPPDQEEPGEKHQYLTEFGDSALYSHEHPPLDKTLIATDVPRAIRKLEALVQRETDQ